MANPPDTFPSDLDVNRLLALLNGVVPSMPSPSPSWSDDIRAQYGPDPSLVAAPASDTPGFHKSPAILEALAAADPRPPGFYRSPALLGASATAQSLDPSLPPTIGPQEMLFGGPGLPPGTDAPLPSNLPSLAKAMARLSAPPGFYKSPALTGSGTPTPSLDPALPPTIDPQMMLFGGPGVPSSSNAPSVSPGLIPTGFPTPSPPPMPGPQATFPAGDPSLIPVQANSTPMTRPRAISRPIGEPPAQPVDPYDIFTRAGLPRPLPMSVPVSPPASPATDGHSGASPGGSPAFLGPVGAAIRSAAVPAAEAVAAMGVGPLLAALASGAAVLFYPSELGDDSCTPPNCGNQYALRGGLAAPADIQRGVTVVKGYEPNDRLFGHVGAQHDAGSARQVCAISQCNDQLYDDTVSGADGISGCVHTAVPPVLRPLAFNRSNAHAIVGRPGASDQQCLCSKNEEPLQKGGRPWAQERPIGT